MTIPLLTGRGVTQDLFVHALRSVYLSGYRVIDPDYASSKEPDIYEKCRRDPVIAHAIDTRLHGVAGRQWAVHPFGEEQADKLVAKVVEDALKRIRRFGEARYEAASAVIRGKSWGYIEGERKLISLGGLPPREWWIPTRIKDVDHRRFRLMSNWKRPGAKADLSVHWEMFSVVNGVWEKLQRPDLFVKVVYNDEEARLGYGRGLLEAIYFYKWVKDRILEEGIQGVAKWARGTVVANIDDSRMGSAGDDNRENDAVRQAWSDAFADMLKNHNIIVGKDDKVQLVESTGTGHQIVTDTLRYLDGGILTLVCGSSLPFGGGEDVGSNGRAQTELNVSESLIQFDREKIDEAMSDDLISLFCRMNRANFSELGLGAGQQPRFETMQEKREDPEKNARILNETLNAGLDIRKDEAYKRTGWTPPQEGDDVIKGRTASANPFGSPFDAQEFDGAMPDKESAKLARVLMKAGTRPDDAVRCAVEAGKASEPEAIAAPPPPPLPQPITVNNHVAAAAPAPVQAAGPINVTSPIHLPERIVLEALNQKPPDIVVNVPKPDPVVVNVPKPDPVVIHMPKPDPVVVNIGKPDPVVVNVSPQVTAEVKLPESIPFKLVLPPTKKHFEFIKDKDGVIKGADVDVSAA